MRLPRSVRLKESQERSNVAEAECQVESSTWLGGWDCREHVVQKREEPRNQATSFMPASLVRDMDRQSRVLE